MLSLSVCPYVYPSKYPYACQSYMTFYFVSKPFQPRRFFNPKYVHNQTECPLFLARSACIKTITAARSITLGHPVHASLVCVGEQVWVHQREPHLRHCRRLTEVLHCCTGTICWINKKYERTDGRTDGR